MVDRVACLDRIGSEALAIGEDLMACAVVPEEIPPGLLETYADRFSTLSGRLRAARIGMSATASSAGKRGRV